MGNFKSFFYRKVSPCEKSKHSNQYVHFNNTYHYIQPEYEQNNYKYIIDHIREKMRNYPNYSFSPLYIKTNSKKFYDYIKSNPLDYTINVKLTLSSLWTSDEIKLVND